LGGWGKEFVTLLLVRAKRFCEMEERNVEDADILVPPKIPKKRIRFSPSGEFDAPTKQEPQIEDEMWEAPKKSQVWVAPAVLQDTDHNPWPEMSDMELVEPGVKIAFVDEGHVYFLQDGKRAYPDLIVTCSRLSKYWATCLKIKSCGDEGYTNIAAAVKMAFDSEGAFRKDFRPSRLTDAEGPNATFVREMLARHLNSFLASNEEPMSFAKRVSVLEGYVPEGTNKSFRNHLRHVSIKILEMWLLEQGHFLPPGDDVAYLEMLRYLRHPIVGFDHIEATSKINRLPLRMFLEDEWMRLGPLPPMTAGDMFQSSSMAPMMSGTIAHKYIEHCLVPPELGTPLPELRESEDYVSIEKLLGYLKEKNIRFLAENIERRVGSMVYKIGGSIDAIRIREEDGVREIWDWKRTQSVHDWMGISTRKYPGDDHWWVCDFSKVNFSDGLMTYFIQAAAYRQLEMMNHPDRVYSTSAFLGAFHPSLDTGFIILELNLDARMKESAISTTKNISDYVDEAGVLVKCNRSISAIEYVQCLMHHRLKHLAIHFNTSPNLVGGI